MIGSSPLRHMLFATAAMLAFVNPLQAAPVEGRDYTILATPQPQEGKGKIEVIEFFSWGCPHCNHFHPLISKWAAQLPSSVRFMRVPVSMGHPQWGQLVRMYYTLESMGELTRLDSAIFDAIHKEKQPLFDEATITAWVAKHGVDAAKFKEVFNSFNVSTRASHSEQMSRDYNVDGIPQIVVAGKYQVLGNNFDQILANATQVIEIAGKAAE